MSPFRDHYRKPSRITVAIAGVTVAAAVSVGAGVAATGPAGQASSTAFAELGTHSAAVQRPAGAARPAQGDQPTAMAELMKVHSEVAAAQAAAQARQAAARAAARAAAKAAAARAAARVAAKAAAARQAAAQQAAAGGTQAVAAAPAPSGSPQQIAAGMLASFGWSSGEFGCLDSLWSHESGWSASASNPASGAYGIPQALPGSKMASAGPDWQTNPATQIRWGLGYIQSTYGSPCSAWSHEQSTGWY